MAGFIKIAHRGSSGSYPENTRIAFEKALEAGVDMIEADCQLSKDGHIVVIHDQRLQRTTGVRGTVKGKTLTQLKKLDAGAWFRKKFRGERILTLEELLNIMAGGADLCLDIKADPASPLGIELKILFILSHYDYLERSIISSLDAGTLRKTREFAPEVRIGVLCSARTKENPFQLAREIDAYSIHLQKETVTAPMMERAKLHSLKTFVWTVNDVTEMGKFLSLGIDGIVSDFPEKFWKVRQRKRSIP